MRGLYTGKLVNRIEHGVRRCGPANSALSAQIVPNLSVMLPGLLKQAGAGAGDVFHGDVGHGAPKFRECLLFEVEAARVLGRQMHVNVQRSRDFAEHRGLRLRKGIAFVFRDVPARLRERRGEGEDGSNGHDGNRLCKLAPHRHAQARPDRSQNERSRNENKSGKHDIEAHESAPERLQHFGRRIAGDLLPDAA